MGFPKTCTMLYWRNRVANVLLVANLIRDTRIATGNTHQCLLTMIQEKCGGFFALNAT